MDAVIITAIIALVVALLIIAHLEHRSFTKVIRGIDKYSPKSGMYGETPRVKIGRFSISQMSNKKGDADIWIENSEGEGGQFRGDDLEKELEEFFNKRF